MKKRTGFVSNSSSSSFIIAYKDKHQFIFDWIRSLLSEPRIDNKVTKKYEQLCEEIAEICNYDDDFMQLENTNIFASNQNLVNIRDRVKEEYVPENKTKDYYYVKEVEHPWYKDMHFFWETDFKEDVIDEAIKLYKSGYSIIYFEIPNNHNLGLYNLIELFGRISDATDKSFIILAEGSN